MKKLLLAASFLIGSMGLTQAQTFVTEQGDTSRGNYAGGADLKVYNKLRSNTSSLVALEWRYLAASSSLPTGWSFDGVCDNKQCFPLSTIGGGTWMVTDSIDNAFSNSPNYLGDENDFHVAFSSMASAPLGTAVVRTEVRNPAAGPSSVRTLTFIASKTTQGVSTYRSDDAVVVYPNPATESVNVLFDERSGVKNIAIYNLIGQPVSVYHVSGNSANLPLGDAPAGVYFVRLLDGQGQILATRRFTRQ